MIFQARIPVPAFATTRGGLPLVRWGDAVAPVEVPEMDRRELVTVATVTGCDEWDYDGTYRVGRRTEVRQGVDGLWMALAAEDWRKGAVGMGRLAEIMAAGGLSRFCGRDIGDHFIGTPFLTEARGDPGVPDEMTTALAMAAAARHAEERIAVVEGEVHVRLPGAFLVALPDRRSSLSVEIPRRGYATAWSVACPTRGEELHRLALSSLPDDTSTGLLYEPSHERVHGARFPWHLSEGADVEHFANLAHGRALALAGNAVRTALRRDGGDGLRQAYARTARWSALGAAGLVQGEDVEASVCDLAAFVEAATAAAPFVGGRPELRFLLAYARSYAMPTFAPPEPRDDEAMSGLQP